MADKINRIEIGGVTYDLQDKKSIFSGTAEEYEAIADTIEDGTVVNITDDFVEGETLDIHVLNKVDELEDKLGSGIKTREELMANAEEGKLADALAIKEALDYYNVAKLFNSEYATLEAFVEATDIDNRIPSIGQFKDNSESGWAPRKLGSQYYRYIIIYQNQYKTNSVADIDGCGLMWQAGFMWNVRITGTKDTGITLTYEVTNKPTIKTRQDLMANEVSGLFPDALAVKDAVNYINMAKHRAVNIATPEEFLDIAGSDVNIPRIFSFRDTTGWGPTKKISEWYHVVIQGQNGYIEGNTNITYMNGAIWTQYGDMWSIHIEGYKGETAKVEFRGLVYKSINPPVEYIPTENLEFTFNDIATNAGLTKEDFIFTKLAVTTYNGDMHHALRVAFTLGKKMPAGALITITMPNVNMNPNGDAMSPFFNGMYNFAAEIRTNNSFRIKFNEELNVNFGVGFTLLYNSYKAISSVLTS